MSFVSGPLLNGKYESPDTSSSWSLRKDSSCGFFKSHKQICTFQCRGAKQMSLASKKVKINCCWNSTATGALTQVMFGWHIFKEFYTVRDINYVTISRPHIPEDLIQDKIFCQQSKDLLSVDIFIMRKTFLGQKVSGRDFRLFDPNLKLPK